MRIKIVENIVLGALVLIALALIYMQVIKGGDYYEQSVNNRIRVIPVEGPRGKITDRQGVLLSENHLAHHVAVIAQDIQDADALFGFLARLLNKEVSFLKRQFQRKKRTPFEPVIIAQDVSKEIIMTVEENRFRYPGLVIQDSYERHYLYGGVNAHAIGYVGKIDPNEADVLGDYGYSPSSMVGKTGVERTYDAILRGEPGGRQIEINNRGKEVRLLGLKDPVKGKDVQLTIDQRIQTAADEFLDGRAGAVVVMDMSNGELLGLVSSPTFDPNAFADRNRQSEVVSYVRDPRALMINRAVAGRFPPGSVFKIPVALAAIELKKIRPEITFDCPGYYMLGKARFGCAHVHGRDNLNQAIAHSCNVYFFQLGRILGGRIIEQYAKAFGFGRVTGVDLPFEASGQVIGQARRGQSWYTGNTLNLSIGQGDTLSTPLQIAVMMAAVANDGILLRPRVVKAVDGKDLPVADIARLPVVRLKDETWRIVQRGLRSVITDEGGTAHTLNELGGMTIFGKTGTAQAGGAKAHHAWFAGYVRSAKNNLAFCVFLENGGSSANAVAVTKQLLGRMQEKGII